MLARELSADGAVWLAHLTWNQGAGGSNPLPPILDYPFGKVYGSRAMFVEKKPKIIDGTECWLCSKCKKWLPAKQFYKMSSAANGLRSNCKTCARQYHIDNRQVNLERNRQYHADNKQACNERSRQYYADNRQAMLEHDAKRHKTPKGRARLAVTNAVRDGVLFKPGRCEKCNEPFEKHLLHGHHEDYSKPLEVEWLCSKCHGKRHRMAA